MDSSSPERKQRHAAQFETTCWSLVLKAGWQGTSDAEFALEKLCQTYWLPLFAEVWSIGDRKQLKAFVGRSVAYSPQGLWAATADDGGSVQLWHLETEKQMAKLTGHTRVARP